MSDERLARTCFVVSMPHFVSGITALNAVALLFTPRGWHRETERQIFFLTSVFYGASSDQFLFFVIYVHSLCMQTRSLSSNSLLSVS